MAITPDLPHEISDRAEKKQPLKSKAAAVINAILRTSRQDTTKAISCPSTQKTPEGARIAAIFSAASPKTAKKGTVEYVRKSLDEQLNTALVDTLQNRALVEMLLSGTECHELDVLEQSLHKVLQPLTDTLQLSDQKQIQALSFKSLIRDKLAELSIKNKVLTREEVQLLYGCEQTLRLVQALQNAKHDDLPQILELCKKIDVLSLHFSFLSEVTGSLENSKLLEAVYKYLLDELGGKLLKEKSTNELSDLQLDLLWQWGCLLETIESMSGSSNLFKKSVGDSLCQQVISKKYLQMAEVETLLVLEYKKIDDKPLCRAHLRATAILSDYLSAKKPSDISHLTAFDKKFLAQFIVHAAGSKELFKRLQMTHNDQDKALLPQIVQEWFSQLTGYGIGKDRFELVGNKLDHLMRAYQNAVSPSDLGKLSQDEFGAAFRACVLYEILEFLLDLGLMQEDEDLMKLAENCATIHANFLAFEELLQKQCKEQAIYQSGDILTTRLKAFTALGSRGIGTEEWLMEHFITDKSHGACLYVSNEEDRALMISHVMKNYQNDGFSLATAYSSDAWRLVAHNLLKTDEQAQALLEKLFAGDDVATQVDAIYQEACRHIHEDVQENYASIQNSRKRQKKAGLADFTPGGHKRSEARVDFQSLHDEFMQPMKMGKEMICSEFVVKAIIVSLIELDRRLLDAAKVKLGPDDAIVKQLEQRQKNEGVAFIDIPISTKERLKRVHPGRLIELLQEKGCILAIKPAPIINHLLQKSAFT